MKKERPGATSLTLVVGTDSPFADVYYQMSDDVIDHEKKDIRQSIFFSKITRFLHDRHLVQCFIEIQMKDKEITILGQNKDGDVDPVNF
jgi:hypothetical protein